MWSYREKRFVETGLQFCGTVMADHSKTAINTQLNTGTVVELQLIFSRQVSHQI